MGNVIIDAYSLKVKAINRSPQSFELSVDNVDLAGISKSVQYTESQDKLNLNGEQLFLLPQADKVETSQVTSIVETTSAIDLNGNQNQPAMATVTQQIPLMENGVQVTYQPTQYTKTTSVTNTPVMDAVTNADGTTSEIQEKDDQGNLLYWGYVPIGSPVKCYTTEEVQQQKYDQNGNKLYVESVTNNVNTIIPQSPLEITENDSSFVEGLESAMEDVVKSKSVIFGEAMEDFDVNDAVTAKESQVIKNTLYQASKLFEIMDESEFDLTKTNCDFVVDKVSLAPNAKAITKSIALPSASSFVGAYLETNTRGVVVSISSDGSSFTQVDSNNEVVFASAVSAVYLQFVNSGTKRVDIKSFGVLV